MKLYAYRRQALEVTAIVASQAFCGIIEASSSSDFTGWTSAVPSFSELSTSNIFETFEISSTSLSIVWILAGYYHSLYDKDRNYKRTIFDDLNTQFIATANVSIVSYLLYIISLHIKFPINNVFIHLLSCYIFNLLFRLLYFEMKK